MKKIPFIITILVMPLFLISTYAMESSIEDSEVSMAPIAGIESEAQTDTNIVTEYFTLFADNCNNFLLLNNPLRSNSSELPPLYGFEIITHKSSYNKIITKTNLLLFNLELYCRIYGRIMGIKVFSRIENTFSEIGTRFLGNEFDYDLTSYFINDIYIKHIGGGVSEKYSDLKSKSKNRIKLSKKINDFILQKDSSTPPDNKSSFDAHIFKIENSTDILVFAEKNQTNSDFIECSVKKRLTNRTTNSNLKNMK